jgi:hypothetical protein
MDEESKSIKIKNARVLTIEEGGWKTREGEERKKWTLVLQDVDNPTTVLTTLCFQGSLPDNVKAGAEIGEVDIDVQKDKNGNITNKVKWERPKSEGGGSYKSGGYRGISPEELQLKKQDLVMKTHQVNTKYAIDLLSLLPPSENTVKEVVEIAKKLNDVAWDEVNTRVQ